MTEITIEQFDKLVEHIQTLVGSASMCWNPPPSGIFDSEEALNVATMLIDGTMEILGLTVVRKPRCVICQKPIAIAIFANSKWCSEICRKRLEVFEENLLFESRKEIQDATD